MSESKANEVKMTTTIQVESSADREGITNLSDYFFHRLICTIKISLIFHSFLLQLDIETLQIKEDKIRCSQTLRRISKCIKALFVLFGIGYVSYGFAETMQKFKEGNVLVKEQVLSHAKYKYPSVTFCYKYKHGSKNVLHNYYPELYKKWKKSGNLLC